MSKNGLRLIVSGVETFRDNGMLESKAEYNFDDGTIPVITYNEFGQPLSGICGDCISWRMGPHHPDRRIR